VFLVFGLLLVWMVFNGLLLAACCLLLVWMVFNGNWLQFAPEVHDGYFAATSIVHQSIVHQSRGSSRSSSMTSSRSSSRSSSSSSSRLGVAAGVQRAGGGDGGESLTDLWW